MTLDRLIELILFNLRRGAQAACYDYVASRRIRDFRLPPNAGPAPPVAVHLVVGREDWRRAAWTLASWHHFTERRWDLVLHDDGTLPPEANTLLQSIFPNARLVSRREADDKMARVLAPYAKCQAYRLLHPAALKVFDAAQFCHTQRFILLESRMLFEGLPQAALDWATAQEEDRRCLFLPGRDQATPLPSGEARQKLKIQVAPNLETGLVLYWRDALDLPFCELALRETSLGSAPADKIGPALLILCASRDQRAAALPEERSVLHYPGQEAVSRFFSEGVRRLGPVLLPSKKV
ncbi:MAG: hypothetical protein AAGK14_07785 [Verrucomicrobiota bacterium]